MSCSSSCVAAPAKQESRQPEQENAPNEKEVSMTDDHKHQDHAKDVASLEQLKNPAHQPNEQPSRSVRRDAAEHIVTQLDIEAAMWQLLGKQPPW